MCDTMTGARNTPRALNRAPVRTIVADDQPHVRSAIRLALTLHGGFVIVAEAADGQQAIELARQHQPDLVLLDLLMPGVGGLEVLPQLRNVIPAGKIAVLSSMSPESGSLTSFQAGADAYYRKTGDMQTLADQLYELCGSTPPCQPA